MNICNNLVLPLQKDPGYEVAFARFAKGRFTVSKKILLLILLTILKIGVINGLYG